MNKINSVNGGTCTKCGEKNVDIVGMNIHKCLYKGNITFKKKTTKWQRFWFRVFHDPALTTKLYTVSCSDYGGGTFKSFWNLEKAIKYAQKQRSPFVDIENEITEESIRVRNNPDGIKPPVRYI